MAEVQKSVSFQYNLAVCMLLNIFFYFITQMPTIPFSRQGKNRDRKKTEIERSQKGWC